MKRWNQISGSKIIAIGMLLLVTVFCMAGCGSKPAGNGGTEEDEPKTFSEGEDTVCEVTGYGKYNGPYASCFLQKGDIVAVISPSSLPTQRQVDAVLKGLKKWGYVPVEGKYVCPEQRTLEECLEDLTWALEDPEVKAIFCVRGGYGASQIMDELTLDLLSKSQKLIIGYSDITVYQSAWTVAGLPSIHSCMSAAFMDLPEACAEVQEHLMQGEVPSYKCEGSPYDKQGSAEGILIGGNLATLTAVLGTAYDCTRIDEPYILFLEDVEEDTQHIHRYLTILKHLGVLEKAAGILFGEWIDVARDCACFDGKTRGGDFTSVADMIDREIMADLEIPTAYGFPAGHGEYNYPLLFGAKARLDVAEDGYTLEWLDTDLK